MIELKIRLTFINEILGSLPKDESIFNTFIKSRAKGKETKEEFEVALTGDALTEKEKKGWTGFQCEDGKPYLADYVLKGFLKNAANVYKDFIGIKNLRSKVNNLVFVSPRKLFFDKPLMDTPRERPLQCLTAQGPRVSLAKSDRIAEGSTIEATITIPIPCMINEKEILSMLDYGQYMGIGQWRNAGHGAFEYEVLSFKVDGIETSVNRKKVKPIGLDLKSDKPKRGRPKKK